MNKISVQIQQQTLDVRYVHHAMHNYN